LEEETILFLTKGRSSLLEGIFGERKVHRTALSKKNDFSEIPGSTVLILLDLDRESDLLEHFLALREYSPLDNVPAWGVSKLREIKRDRLFLTFGGNRIVNTMDLKKLLIKGLWEQKGPARSSQQTPFIPSLAGSSRSRRLAEQLDLALLEQQMAGIQQKNTQFIRSMEEYLEILFSLVEPHLAIILINDNQQAEGYVKPSPLIFEQDYRDFMNFCLNDFFNHFQGLNLEKVKEVFFLKSRKDFTKLNMTHQRISSYIYFPITNQDGKVEATLHLGHLSNNYFSEKLINRINRFVQAGRGSFFYVLKKKQNSIRQKKILNIFSRFVPEEIIPELIRKEHNKENEKVEKREITILFSDIRSFTTITEQNEAQEVVNFLNRHFEIMVACIKKHGGTIDKFIGDAIVAMFGVPVDYIDNSTRAVRAAMEMISSLKRVDCSGLNLNNGSYGIGIGIHEGDAIIGNVGSKEKADFTAMGDVIAIAEELEAMTKNYSSPILMSDRVQNSVSQAIRTREVDQITLGKNENMTLYSPLKGAPGETLFQKGKKE
jgi:class 3 adenylate cyclase